MSNESEIKAAARRFRCALAAGGLRSIGLQEFPLGACRDAAELLGEYLKDSGFGEWVYRGGSLDTSHWSHGWIEQGGLVVDITADQFDGIAEQVIVTRDTSWHDQFSTLVSSHIAGMNFTGPAKEDLQADYLVLRARADEGPEQRVNDG